jgi:exopolysaccharide biosynthesis polyprenyl glycosylphosphotransferase
MSTELDSSPVETAIRDDRMRGDALLWQGLKRSRGRAVRRRGWVVARTLLVADVLGFAIALAATQVLFLESNNAADARGFVLTVPIWIVVGKLYGLYEQDEQHTDHSTVDDLVNIFHMTMVGALLSFAVVWAAGLSEPDFRQLTVFWLLSVCFVTIGRAAARVIAHQSPTFVQRTVIVGAGDVGQTVARKLLQHPEYGVDVVGFVDSEPKERGPGLADLTVLGELEELPEIVRRTGADRVVVAFSRDSHRDLLRLIRSLRGSDVQIDIVPRLYEILGPSARLHSAEGVLLLGLPPLWQSPGMRMLKRGMDLIGACVALLLLLPAFVVIAILIKRDSEGPVFFRQVRMGRADKTFRICKFRTMVVDADIRKSEFENLNIHRQSGGDPRMFKIRKDPRCTKIGLFLRRYSLDELPQLINVVTGDMSLVGPRPLILEEDRHVEEWARCRLDFKPGMTGPWQVLGASSIPFEEMVRLDYLYITEWSLFNDFKWLWRTVPTLLRSHG